jgi:hypothetical protein
MHSQRSECVIFHYARKDYSFSSRRRWIIHLLQQQPYAYAALCLYNVELDEKITDAPVTLFVNALCTHIIIMIGGLLAL